MSTITQFVTPYTKVPSINSPSTFESDVDIFLNEINSRVTESNDMASQMNTVAEEVNTNALSASDSALEADTAKTIAIGAANYKGDWVSGYNTTGYSVGMSVTYNGYEYISKTSYNLTTPPSQVDNTYWKYIDTVDAANFYTKTQADTLFQVKLASSYTQPTDTSIASGTYTFNYSNGDMIQVTATGSFTLAFSGFVSGKVCVAIIDAVNWGNYTVTLPTGLFCNNKTKPTFTSNGTDRLIIIKDKDNIYHMVVNPNIGIGV